MKTNATNKPEPAPENGYLFEHIRLLARNYQKLLGRPLFTSDAQNEELAREIYEAPFILLSHGTEEFPVFNYANLAAQKLFGYTWREFTALESRYSAIPDDRETREHLLKEVKEKGFIKGYTGIRISKTGEKFYIKNIIVWNLYDNDDNYCGQAAIYDQWEFVE